MSPKRTSASMMPGSFSPWPVPLSGSMSEAELSNTSRIPGRSSRRDATTDSQADVSGGQSYAHGSLGNEYPRRLEVMMRNGAVDDFGELVWRPHRIDESVLVKVLRCLDTGGER